MASPSDLSSIYLAVFTASIVLLGFAGAILVAFNALFNASSDERHLSSKVLTIVASAFMVLAAATSLGEAWQQDISDWWAVWVPLIFFFVAAILTVWLIWRGADVKLVAYSPGAKSITEPAPEQHPPPKSK